MKIFVAVYECDGVTAAAEKLHIAQPSVSLAINDLERHYGVRLFDRISRRMHITEQGKEFLSYANRIVSLFEDLDNKVKNWDKIGIIKVGSSITIANYLLEGFVREFNKEKPDIKVHIKIDNSEEIEKRVVSNKVDFGLIEGIPSNNQLVKKKLMKDQLVLVCGNSHQLAQTDEIDIEGMKNQDFILREKGSGSRELFDSTMLINDTEILPIAESISNSAIIQLAIGGLGLTVVPYMLVKKHLEEGKLHRIKIKEIIFDRDLYLIHHKNKFLSESAQQFMDICMLHS